VNAITLASVAVALALGICIGIIGTLFWICKSSKE